MAYCPDCGAEVSKGVKFCSECGTSLEDSAAANSPPAGSASGTSGTNERGSGGTTAADGATASTTSAGGTATADATATTTSSTAGTADDPENQESSLDLPANQAAALSYVLGLLTGLVVFIIEDENEFVQFHAAQSIVLSVAFGGLYLVFGVLTSILSFLPDVIGVLLISLLGLVQAVIGLAGFVAWVYLMIQAYQGERFVAPVIGGFAENLAKQG
ncbi:zinc-ribbon domain-containing protein [Haloglomus halophilum]|uniref:zinc-ribbon domain-containing protein n=1 Tax=Haloglomus halophilum TaxID=2962672 RepID=UPI0020C97B64|nr:zinc-ribbon domain-containing protein [Haloglomus halophilum]